MNFNFKVVCYKMHQRKDGKRQINIKVSQRKKCIYIPTGVYVPKEFFSKGKISNSYKNNTRLNAEIYRNYYNVQKWVLDKLREDENLTLKAVKIWSEHQTENFYNFACKVLEEDHRLAPSTKKRHRTALRHLKEFDSNLCLTQMNLDFFKSFDRYLKIDANQSQNTRRSLIKVIKRYLNDAASKGLINANLVPKYNVKEVDSNRCALTMAEVLKLESLPNLTAGESEILELFLFGCYTGLRFQDLTAICAQNFRSGADGLELNFRAQKTAKILTLPLELLFNGRPYEIIKPKLSSLKKGKEMKKPFWTVTNQHANRVMKDLALRAGIFKRVTMHVSRHTFATILAPKVPTKILQELLQHSSIKTTMAYVHLSNLEINSNIKKAFQND